MRNTALFLLYWSVSCVATFGQCPLSAHFSARSTKAAAGVASLVAPGAISTGAHEGAFAFSPDGQSLYFTRLAPGMTTPKFFESKAKDGQWSEAREIALPEGVSANPFTFLSDGSRLLFTHTRDSKHRFRLWLAERDGNGWKNTRPLPGAIEKWDGDQTSPSVTSDGTLYFVGRLRDHRGWDIYRSAMKDGEYSDPELIGGDRYGRISTPHNETSVAVSTDGSFIVFSSTRAPNGFGGTDLYLSELPGPGAQYEWTWNLGPAVNTDADEEDPRLSPDGKHLYFTRSGDIYEIDLESLRRAPADSSVWKSRTEMPINREWPQLAAAKGHIYVYGGFTGQMGPNIPRRWAKEVDVYDVATDTWSRHSESPQGWEQATLVAFEDRLFLFRRGGPGIAEYNNASQRWEVKQSADSFALGTAPPFWTRTVVLGRKAYTTFTAGGLREYSYFVEYDFDKNTWAPKRSMPYPAPQLAAWNNRIYVFAGGADPTHANVYDPATDQWTEVARMDMPRWESAVAVVGDEIWLIGGHGLRSDEPMDGDISPTVMRYLPQRNQWVPGPSLPYQRAAASAIVVDGRLFVIGGLKPGANFTQDRSVMEYVSEK